MDKDIFLSEVDENLFLFVCFCLFIYLFIYFNKIYEILEN